MSIVGEAVGATQASIATVVLIGEQGCWTAAARAAFADNGIVVRLDLTGASLSDESRDTADAAIVHMGLLACPAVEVFAAWRASSTGPLLAVAPVNADEATILDAYAAGVDHVSPFDATPRQLVAHLRSLLRRVRTVRAPIPDTERLAGPMQLDHVAEVALIDGQKVELTSAEFSFLRLLLERTGRIVHRAELRKSLDATDREVDFFVRRLRDKLERTDGRRRIVAVRSVGFRFDAGEGVAGGPSVAHDDLQQGAPA